MSEDKFYTLRGYDLRDRRSINYTMEDYLEMIYRHTRQAKALRVKELAELLHVRPSSVSKMVVRLRDLDLVSSEPYGTIALTEAGQHAGAYLLHRHQVLERFFRLLNDSDDELELVERIEHFFTPQTVLNIEILCQNMTENMREAEEETTATEKASKRERPAHEK